jgi:hypothetical protein
MLSFDIKLISTYIVLSSRWNRRANVINYSVNTLAVGHWLQIDEPEQVARLMLGDA